MPVSSMQSLTIWNRVPADPYDEDQDEYRQHEGQPAEHDAGDGHALAGRTTDADDAEDQRQDREDTACTSDRDPASRTPTMPSTSAATAMPVAASGRTSARSRPRSAGCRCRTARRSAGSTPAAAGGGTGGWGYCGDCRTAALGWPGGGWPYGRSVAWAGRSSGWSPDCPAGRRGLAGRLGAVLTCVLPVTGRAGLTSPATEQWRARQRDRSLSIGRTRAARPRVERRWRRGRDRGRSGRSRPG